jgi:hypothetical protein
MIFQILVIVALILMAANATAYIFISCENSSMSTCGNGTQLKQAWEYERTQYTPPFFKWIDWLRSMWG